MANTQSPIGLLAAWGRFPILVAEALRRQGRAVVCLGVKHHADPELRNICNEFSWTGGAQLGKAVRWFRRHRVGQATMAGKFHKTMLYRPGMWASMAPDWYAIRTFWPHFVSRRRDRSDDTLLGALVAGFAARGIEFKPATDFAPELLVAAGQIAGRAPTKAQQLDIDFGWRLAKEMGRLDIGQSVCVKERAVLAIEAIEGTDQCIQRAGKLCTSGGFTVVKVAKPQQDMRFDVPTIGVGTLETMSAAGGRVLAVEAGRTILLDEPEFRRVAQQRGLAVVAIARNEMSKAAA